MELSKQEAELQAVEAMGLPGDGDLPPNLYKRLLDINGGNKNDTLPAPLIELLKEIPVTSSCAVCGLEDAAVGVVLPCGHAFHKACAHKWLTECKDACPLCGQSADPDKTTPAEAAQVVATAESAGHESSPEVDVRAPLHKRAAESQTGGEGPPDDQGSAHRDGSGRREEGLVALASGRPGTVAEPGGGATEQDERLAYFASACRSSPAIDNAATAAVEAKLDGQHLFCTPGCAETWGVGPEQMKFLSSLLDLQGHYKRMRASDLRVIAVRVGVPRNLKKEELAINLSKEYRNVHLNPLLPMDEVEAILRAHPPTVDQPAEAEARAGTAEPAGSGEPAEAEGQQAGQSAKRQKVSDGGQGKEAELSKTEEPAEADKPPMISDMEFDRMFDAVAKEVDEYSQITQIGRLAKSIFKDAAEQHVLRLLEDAKTTATAVRSKKRVSEIDAMNAAARGADGSLHDCFEHFRGEIARPSPFELKKATYGKLRKAAALPSLYVDLKGALAGLLAVFMKKVLQAAVQSALENKRKRVASPDFKHALSICSRTLM